MTLDFSCPWCGADTTIQGSEQPSWRFRLPCELCGQQMVVTWDGGLVVGRVATEPLAFTDETTVRIKKVMIG